MTLAAEALTTGFRRPDAVLRDVTLALRPRAVTAIVGPNGAGKSTLLRALLGSVRPWSGRCSLGGADMRSLSPRRRAASIAYIPQRPSVEGSFTARQVVALGRHALPRDERAVDSALSAAGVLELSSGVFASLSVGQQQRVALARALAQLGWREGCALDPRALLADEPVAAMDPRHALATLKLLRSVARAGAAVAVVLHDLTSALRCADDAIILAASGRIAGSGPAARTLTPDALQAAFGVPFEIVSTAGGPAVEPGPA